MEREQNDYPYPVVRVALGESLAEVQRLSTLRFPPTGDSIRASVNITDPVEVELGSGPDLLRFPVARFVALAPLAGHVVQVRLSPHLTALTIDEVFALANDMERRLETHGWRRSRMYAAPDSVRRASALSAGGDVYNQSLSEWVRDGDRATLTVKRLRSPKPQAAWDGRGPVPSRLDDRFLLDVRIDNDSILNRFDALDRCM